MPSGNRLVSLSVRENLVGLPCVLTGYDVNVAAVMEIRHDTEPDVLVWVGNDPDNPRHAFLIAQIHDPFDVGSTGEVHRLQIAQVNQQVKVWSQARKSRLNFLGVKLGFLQANVLGEDNCQ